MSSDYGTVSMSASAGRRGSAASSMTNNDGAPGRWSTSQMESSVTRLLVATKQLLEALTRWSLRNRCTESDVSDIYVRLGNDFNSAKLAFQSYGISMDDLASVPGDLRTCLEECLSEEASPQVLEVHLPRIREIIIGLLQGLKMKQAEYKQLLLIQRANSATSRAEAGAASSGPAAGGSHVSGPRAQRYSQQQSSEASAEYSGNHINSANNVPDTNGASHRAYPQASSSNVQDQLSPETMQAKQPSLRALRSRDALERRASKRFSTYTFSKIAGAGHHAHAPSSSGLAQLAHLGMGPGVSAGAAAAAAGLQSDMSNGVSMVSSANSSASGHATNVPPAVTRRDSNTSNSTRRNAVMNPSSGYSHRMTDSTTPSSLRPDRDIPVVEVQDENERKEGEAEQSEMVADADSMPTPKRPSPPPQPPTSAPSSSASSSQTTRAPPNAPPRRQGSINAQNGAASGSGTSSSLTTAAGKTRVSSLRASPDHDIPPVPSLPAQIPTPPSLSPNPSSQNLSAKATSPQSSPQIPQPSPQQQQAPRSPLTGELTVFVQQGRQTKRATISLGIPLSIARLRMLFIDKFGYSPGKDDFPPIYVKDQKTGVDYELEESELMQVNALGVDRVGEGGVVKDGMVLSLNIEPLDQVKQHLDLTLGNLTREVRELKSAFQEREREARRISRNYGQLLDPNTSLGGGDSSAMTLAASPLPSPKISDSQFAAAGQRMAQMRRANTLAAAGVAPGSSPVKRSSSSTNNNNNNNVGLPPRSDSNLSSADRIIPVESGGILRAISPQPTGSSSISSHAAAGMAAAELKTQHDEILRLRREFAVLAQVQADFQTDFKGLLGQLRAQSQRVREIAAQDVTMERNFIVAGKARLDTTSQEVLTLVEDLQDTVDDLRQDVTNRGVKPKPTLLKKITQDLANAVQGVEDLEAYVRSVKPSWKKTWEVELQNIVDEQEFLNYEEGLLADLRVDCESLQEVFDNIQQVVKLRVSSARAGSSGGRGYLPPPPEEGHQGLDTVMLEVRSQAVDHDRRLKAVEAAEEKRQREMQSSGSTSNEFADELAGFVEGKVLRRTGGHVEAERIRQKRNDATLRSMLTGEGIGGAPQTVQPLNFGGGGGGSGSGGGGGSGESGEGTLAEKPKRLVLANLQTGSNPSSPRKGGLPSARSGGPSSVVSPTSTTRGGGDESE
ncbi:Bud site selection protein 6 [Tilletia horrida]|nr:Bud site selection protein 6 [Tilletia horrida]